jgi:hypothetical protein
VKRGVVAVVLALTGLSAGAVPIYRCGKTYSQIPCAGGEAIDASDSRSAAQRTEAQRASERDKRLGIEMEHDRLDRQARTPRLAAGFDTLPRPAESGEPVERHATSRRGKRKAASATDFIAIKRKSKTARRRP